jgi:hypothetical protein
MDITELTWVSELRFFTSGMGVTKQRTLTFDRGSQSFPYI